MISIRTRHTTLPSRRRSQVATLAARLAKPLACRVWPTRGARAGEHVRFKSPFFVDSAVVPLRPADAVAAAARASTERARRWRALALAAGAVAAALAFALAAERRRGRR